jgi:ACS family hexuronate transporter-like MFS transporter
LFSLSVFRFVLGFGEGGHWPAAIKGVVEWLPVKERALGMGIVNTGATLGSAIAPPLIVWLELSFGWRTTFLVTGLLGFAWMALWAAVYRSPQEHPWLRAAELRLIESGTSEYAQSFTPQWRTLLKNRQVLGIVFARFLGDPVWWLYLVWLPLYLFQARGLTLKAIGASAWIPFLCADAGALLGGWFSGWLIRRGWSLLRARKTAIGLATLLSPVGIFIPGIRSETEALALMGVVLFAFQFWVNNVQILTGDLFSNEMVASISGLAGTAAGIGAMIFTFSTGWIVDRFGYTPVLVASGMLIPAATGTLFWLARGNHPRSVIKELGLEVC